MYFAQREPREEPGFVPWLWSPYLYFSCLIALAGTYRVILRVGGGSRQPCLSPHGKRAVSLFTQIPQKQDRILMVKVEAEDRLWGKETILPKNLSAESWPVHT